MLKVSEGDTAENWKERMKRMTSEIYLLERVLRVGVAMVTSELR